MLSDGSRTAATALAVAVGGAVGAALRYRVWRCWPDDAATFPLTTFTINVVGCFLFGMCIGVIPDTGRDSTTIVRAFLMFGVLAGFTTFSFFAVQGVTLTSPRVGVLCLVLTPAVAAGAAWAGRACAFVLPVRARRARRHAQ